MVQNCIPISLSISFKLSRSCLLLPKRAYSGHNFSMEFLSLHQIFSIGFKSVEYAGHLRTEMLCFFQVVFNFLWTLNWCIIHHNNSTVFQFCNYLLSWNPKKTPRRIPAFFRSHVPHHTNKLAVANCRIPLVKTGLTHEAWSVWTMVCLDIVFLKTLSVGALHPNLVRTGTTAKQTLLSPHDFWPKIFRLVLVFICPL